MTLTFNTTAAQDAKLAKALVLVNKQRTQNGAAAYASVAEWFTDELTRVAKSYFAQVDTQETSSLKFAYLNAPDADKAQIKAILHLT